MKTSQIPVWDQLLKLKKLPFGSVHCIKDPDIEKEISEIIEKSIGNDCLNDSEINSKFVQRYFDWINDTKNNKLLGLENFNNLSYSNGTTESFDKFYMKYRHRRLRYFSGEYLYHVAAAKFSFDQSATIEDDDIRDNDVVVISLPFAGTGNKHPHTEYILDRCDALDVPVLIDCCYFGVCSEIEFNFNHPSIKDITFSLSKNFPVQHLRIGMRASRDQYDDLLAIYNRNAYLNRIGAAVGLELLDRYDSDYNFNTYRTTQEDFCKILDLSPSNCVFFGTSTTQYHEYNRGTKENRLCFSKYLKARNLPTA
jgi:hypothetical protein